MQKEKAVVNEAIDAKGSMFDGSCRTAPVRWVRPRSGHVGGARQECRGQRRGRRDMRATVAKREKEGATSSSVFRCSSLSLLISFVLPPMPHHQNVASVHVSSQHREQPTPRKDRRRKERKNSHTSIDLPAEPRKMTSPKQLGHVALLSPHAAHHGRPHGSHGQEHRDARRATVHLEKKSSPPEDHISSR